MSSRALVIASLIGTLLQVAMVVAGHSNDAIKGLFAVGGMGLSLIAGVLYSRLARPATKGSAASGGLAAGAICAFIGILVSHLLGDVPASLLALGTLSSAVTGAVGGWLGALGTRPAATAVIVAALVTAPAGAMHAQASASLSVTTDVRGDTSATLRDFQWLVGRWKGTVPAVPGSVADVTFAAPSAGLMTGMMRLVQNDAVLVVELISLVDTPRGVELRFRHFSPALDAYEREFKQTMRLTKHEPRSDTFENTVPFDAKLMSTQPRRSSFIRTSDDEYEGRSDIIGSDGKPAEVVARYVRQ